MCICILSFSNKHFIESFWAFWRLQNSFIYFCVFISIPIFSCNIYLSKIISNRRFPEITGEIIWKSEAPAVGHHFRHRLLAYTGTWFQNEGGSRKVLVCDSIRPSGMVLYYTGLPDVRYALEIFFLLLFSPHTMVFLAGPHAVCPFGMADWLNRLRVFIIYTVFLIKKKKCKKIIGSLCCIISSTSWLTRSRSLRAEDRIQNQE